MPRGRRKSNVLVSSSFYAEWRVRSGIVPLLHDECDSPPESLLQAIWQHQRLRRDQLHTLDGQPVRILHPGFRSFEGGPDFRDAVVQFGEETPRSGDIEVDLRASGWRAHAHDRNPAFRNVILHVIWEGEPRAGDASSPPPLTLQKALDSSLGELSLWLGAETAPALPEEQLGRCCAPLRSLNADRRLELLHQAALVRLRSKGAQFQARARHVGWEQALWEGLFRALGYKHNAWPMQCLAELRPKWAAKADGVGIAGRATSQEKGASALAPLPPPGGKETSPAAGPSTLLALQSRLLGLSGLLPSELTRGSAGADSYLRLLWDQWWRERDEFADCVLPRSLWRLHGLRPANHPQRRLALAAHWLADGDLPARLERWCAQEVPRSSLAASLHEVLQVKSDDFWSWHFTFRSARLKRPQPLLGDSRVTDLAVNAVLPWLWVRALEGRNQKVQRGLEERYFAWPPAQDNSLLRLARQRLLDGASGRALTDAAAQQGLIQIVRDFCDHSNALCEQCRMPALVQDLSFTEKARLENGD